MRIDACTIGKQPDLVDTSMLAAGRYAIGEEIASQMPRLMTCAGLEVGFPLVVRE
jgi:hypothetical protein